MEKLTGEREKPCVAKNHGGFWEGGSLVWDVRCGFYMWVLWGVWECLHGHLCVWCGNAVVGCDNVQVPIGV